MRLVLFFVFFTLSYFGKSQNAPEYVFSGGRVVIGKKVWQVDLGSNVTRVNQQAERRYQNQYGQYINLKYGLSDKGHINFNYNYSRTVSYVAEDILKMNNSNNLNIGYKHTVWDHISMQAVLGINRHLKELSNYNFQLQAIAEHPVGDRLTWQNNLGFSSVFNQLNITTNYLSGLTYSFPKPLDIIFEVYGNFNQANVNTFCNLGLGYYFSKNFMTELYLGYGESASNPNVFTSINLYYRLLPNGN